MWFPGSPLPAFGACFASFAVGIATATAFSDNPIQFP